jgi:fimbrial isopeptide formation D2 family protein
MVVEKENPAVIQVVDAFFVIVPGTTEDGSGYAYTVNVYPKNTTETGPDIKKDVTAIENAHDTFNVDEIHTWIIRGGVPAGIAQAEKYVITDTLDYRLTLKENFVVKVGLETDPAGAETVTLQPNQDYAVTVSQILDDDGNKVDTFEVALTADGMKAVAAAVSGGTGMVADYELRVYFDAVIDSDAQMGQEIPNQAKVDYVNATGMEYEAESDIPEVHTGGIHLRKTDVEGRPLAGAQFRIARPATEEEMTKDYGKYVYRQDPDHYFYGKIVEGGRDNYFNNSEYRSGWTYHGTTIGLPLLLPWAPSEDGVTYGIVNNRVRGHHFGIKGVVGKVPYMLKATYTSNWGRYSNGSASVFESRPKQLSLALEVNLGKQVTRLPVDFAVGAYCDYGKLYQNSAGLSLRVLYNNWRVL